MFSCICNRDSYVTVCQQSGVSGSAKLCCTVSHIILLPPFSVLTMPPERECTRLLAECVSVYVGVCLACCGSTLLVSGDLKLHFYGAACVWWRWLFGWNVETDLWFFFKYILLENVLMAQVVVMTAQSSLPLHP